MIDRILRDRLIDAYMGLIPLIRVNVLWVLCSLPLITLIPATGALMVVTFHLAKTQRADTEIFFQAFRQYFKQSWAVGLMNLFVGVAIGANLYYYGLYPHETWTGIARIIVLILSVGWVSFQMQIFPLLLEQEKPSVRLAMRNSIVILLKRPLFTLGAGFLMGLCAIASTFLMWPLWLVLTGSGCAYIANLATRDSIQQIKAKALPQVEESS